ncbi:MAG: hypothetical protein LBB77_07715 [Treponema sp.]|jgi:hypothetical protein|nr:hypothetical protein [Treponema sp.]
MKRFLLLAGVCLAGLVSCVSQPELQSEKPVSPAPVEPSGEAPIILVTPVPADPVPESPPGEPVPDEAPVFDYSNITEEIRTHTRVEIQQLIGELDGIIEDENYQAWINNLDASYLEKISSKDFLAAQSQSPRLKSQESLKSVEEYFKKVVVPSRANTDYHIDDIDIQFIPEEEKVLAFLTTSAGRRLRLYELKNVNGTWKIAN